MASAFIGDYVKQWLGEAGLTTVLPVALAGRSLLAIFLLSILIHSSNVIALDTDNDFFEDVVDNCPTMPNGVFQAGCAADPGSSCNNETFLFALIERIKDSYLDCLISQNVPAQDAVVELEAGPCTHDLLRGLLADAYNDECAGGPCDGIQEDANTNTIGDACECAANVSCDDGNSGTVDSCRSNLCQNAP